MYVSVGVHVRDGCRRASAVHVRVADGTAPRPRARAHTPRREARQLPLRQG